MSTDDHLSPVRLAAEGSSPAEVQHLSSCARCRVDRARAREFFRDASARDHADDRYEDRGLVSRGGMGEVRRVYDRQLRRVVAMKVLRAGGPSTSDSGDERTWEARFLREAEVMSHLDHPAIVPVHDRGVRADGSLYYTMRFVRGATLEERLRAARTFADRLALVPHFAAVCQAVAYAHGEGIVHRDLKPRNIMVGDFGEAVVLDWGIAKVRGEVEILGERNHPGEGETEAGTILGTPGYMSPEQAQGRVADVDERADVWSLGAVLFEILTGRPPAEGGDLTRLAWGRLGVARPVRAVDRRVPADLAAVADKALSSVPGERYRDAGDLAAEIQSFLDGERVRVYRYSSWELLLRLVRQNRGAMGVAVVAGMIVAVSTVQLARTNDALGAARAEEDRAALATRRQLAVSLVDRGRQEVLRDRPTAALPSFAGALRAVEGLPEEGAARARLKATLEAAPRLVAVIPLGLRAPARALALSDDGRLLAARTGAGVEVWDVGRREWVATVGHAAFAMAFSLDGRLATLGGGELAVWTTSGELLAATSSPEGRALTLAWTNDGCLVTYGWSDAGPEGERSRVATGFDPDQRARCRPPRHADPLSPDGLWLARREEMGAATALRFARLEGGGGLGSPILVDPRAIVAMARSAPYAVMAGPGRMTVWLARLEGPDGIGADGAYLALSTDRPVDTLAVSDDGQRIAYADDASIHLAAAEGPTGPLAASVTRARPEGAVAWDADLDRVAVADGDGVSVWDFRLAAADVGRPHARALPADGGGWWLPGRDEAPTRTGEAGVRCQADEQFVGPSFARARSADGRLVYWSFEDPMSPPAAVRIHACDAASGRAVGSIVGCGVLATAGDTVMIAGYDDHVTAASADLSIVRWRGSMADAPLLSPDGHRLAVVRRPGRTSGPIPPSDEALRQLAADWRIVVHDLGGGPDIELEAPDDWVPTIDWMCPIRFGCALRGLPFDQVVWAGSRHLAFTHGPHVHVLDLTGGHNEVVIAHPAGGDSPSRANGAVVSVLVGDPGGNWIASGDAAGRMRTWRPDGTPFGPWLRLPGLAKVDTDVEGRYLRAELPAGEYGPTNESHTFEVETGEWVTAQRGPAGRPVGGRWVSEWDDGDRPVAEWVDLAEVVSGVRAGGAGEVLGAEERADRLAELRTRFPDL